MSNICRHCVHHNNIKACLDEPCNQRETWIYSVVEETNQLLTAHNEQLQQSNKALREALNLTHGYLLLYHGFDGRYQQGMTVYDVAKQALED